MEESEIEEGTTRQELAVLFRASRRNLLSFIESKVSAPTWPGTSSGIEDILQNSMLKALRAAPNLRDEDKLVPWLHRIIRNAILDALRSRQRRDTRQEQFAAGLAAELAAEGDEEAMSLGDETMICLCFRALLPTLKEEYRVVIEELELEGRDPEEMARTLGIPRNNLNVRRHRARRQLRRRLEETCTTCPEHGYFDCGCERPPAHVQSRYGSAPGPWAVRSYGEARPAGSVSCCGCTPAWLASKSGRCASASGKATQTTREPSPPSDRDGRV